MKRLTHICTLIIPLMSAAAHTVSLTLKSGETEISGFANAMPPMESDSAVDFSETAKYGDDALWKYLWENDSTLIEHRGTSWRSYLRQGDSLLLSHREDYREKTDVETSDSISVNEHGEKPYRAYTRRDMTFCYADSGFSTAHVIITPVLILAEGDTVANGLCVTERRRFERRAGETGAPLGVIEETEKTWVDAGSYVTLAYASSRSVKVDGVITSAADESVVFPRTLNEAIVREAQSRGVFPLSDTAATPTHHNAAHAAISDITPAVSLENRTLRVQAAFPSDVTVCDVSGRVWRNATNVDGDTAIPLAGLPEGEYVVAVTTAGTVSSTTITLRP